MFKKAKLILKTATEAATTKDETWAGQFRHNQTTYWFWDHFNWETQSLWIGKMNRMNRLPSTDEQIMNFLRKLVVDLNQNTEFKNHIYIKFYFTRNINTHEPEINYLLVNDSQQLPPEFSDTLIDIIFERYQLTEKIINQNENFRNLVNHYINWNDFYPYYNLISEVHN
jgi:hypothetical protein